MAPLCFQFFTVGVRKVSLCTCLTVYFYWRAQLRTLPIILSSAPHLLLPPCLDLQRVHCSLNRPIKLQLTVTHPPLPNTVHFFKSTPNHSSHGAAPDYSGRRQALLNSSLQQLELLCGTLFYLTLSRCHSCHCKILQVKG